MSEFFKVSGDAPTTTDSTWSKLRSEATEESGVKRSQPYKGPVKSFSNNRFTKGKPGPRKVPTSTASAEGGKVPKGLKANDDDDEEYDPATDTFKKKQKEEIPPEIASMIFDYDGWDTVKNKIDTTGMDDIDRMLADAFVYSNNTSDGVFRVVLQSPEEIKKYRLPKARGIRELVNQLKPDPIIYNYPLASETAAQAHEVSSQSRQHDTMP